MKATASIHGSMFLHSSLPLAATWGENRPAVRRHPHVATLPSLSTDELAASKAEVACGGILGLCFFYTLIHCVAQMIA